MAATIEQIRQGLATNLASCRTLADSTTVPVSAYMLDGVPPPLIQVMGPDDVNYDQAAARGMDEVLIAVQAFGGPMTIGAQQVLDEWLKPTGTRSIKAAIESDRTLGGIVQDAVVTKASGYRQYKMSDATVVLGCEWQVRVLNSGA